MITLEGLWDYKYDDLGQLTAWTAPDGRHVEYDYDALGNRITVTDNGSVTNYSANNMNQYTQVGDTTYQFDADGNLIQKIAPAGMTTYTYNHENRLVAVSSPEGNWTYIYDAFGNRIRVVDNGAVTDFVIDPIGFGDVVGEYDHTSDDLVAHYHHGFGLLSRTEAIGDAAYYTFDAIGSTSELTGNFGIVLNLSSYLPFGELMAETGSAANPFKYVGEYGVMHESCGSLFMEARQYSAKIGRFFSADPLNLLGEDTNLYRYVINLPTRYIDPLGLKWSDPGIIDPNKFGNEDYWNKERYRNDDRTPGPIGGPWPTGPSGPSQKDFYEWVDDLDKKKWWHLPPWSPIGIPGAPPFPPLDLTYFPKNPVPPVDPTTGQPVQPVRPCDPNEKTCPTGFGEAGYIAGDSLFSYRVNFENDETATAPAQIVTITDQLDEDLDWSTFNLTEIGFGDVRIAVPANTHHFETTVPMSYNGVGFEVQIEAGIHLATGEVYANFYSIEALSGLPPSVDTGFLPPEDGTGRGQGYFTYIIKAKEGLSVGTEIRNVALITFDFQESIATNQVDPHDPAQGTDPNKESLNTIAPDEVNLMTTSTEGGSVTSPGEGTVTCDWGEIVDLIAAPDEKNCIFVNWTGDVDTIADIHATETTVTMYGNFSISANFATGMPVHLKKGFNLIAIPADVTKQPDLRDWLPMLGNSSEIEKVMVYDGQAGKFITLIPGDPSNPGFTLEGGEGLIVYAMQDKEITFTSVLCSTHYLRPGFNLVGFACPENGYSAYQLLNNLGYENISSIQRYSTDKGVFETAGFGPDGQVVGVDFPIVRGEGYFIFMKGGVVLDFSVLGFLE